MRLLWAMSVIGYGNCRTTRLALARGVTTREAEPAPFSRHLRVLRCKASCQHACGTLGLALLPRAGRSRCRGADQQAAQMRQLPPAHLLRCCSTLVAYRFRSHKDIACWDISSNSAQKETLSRLD